jgi:thiamine pyrophosphokinase
MQCLIIGYVEDYQNSQRMRQHATRIKGEGAYLICVDSGGEAALAWSLQPDLLIGDMDSISSGTLRHYRKQNGVEILIAPHEKEETDLELALNHALKHNATRITIIGGLGGRLDHTLGNLYLLAIPPLQNVPTNLVAEKENIVLLHGGKGAYTLNGTKGDTVSLIPLNGNAEGITLTNFYYPLKNETLYFGPGRGISNELVADTAQIELKSGLLLVVHNVTV